MSDTVHVDKAIASKILAGDERAFKTLFDRFFPRLYRYAVVRLDGDREAARDVVQQTFCKAIRQLKSYRGEASLYAWFCRICRNTVIDYCRARRREPHQISLAADRKEIQAVMEALSAPVSDQPEKIAMRRDLGRLVQAILDNLPQKYGDVLEWKYAEGMSVNEIADRLELGPKAAESLLTRARVAFRETVAAMGDSLEDWFDTGSALGGSRQ